MKELDHDDRNCNPPEPRVKPDLELTEQESKDYKRVLADFAAFFWSDDDIEEAIKRA